MDNLAINQTEWYFSPTLSSFVLEVNRNGRRFCNLGFINIRVGTHLPPCLWSHINRYPTCLIDTFKHFPPAQFRVRVLIKPYKYQPSSWRNVGTMTSEWSKSLATRNTQISYITSKLTTATVWNHIFRMIAGVFPFQWWDSHQPHSAAKAEQISTWAEATGTGNEIGLRTCHRAFSMVANGSGWPETLHTPSDGNGMALHGPLTFWKGIISKMRLHTSNSHLQHTWNSNESMF